MTVMMAHLPLEYLMGAWRANGKLTRTLTLSAEYTPWNQELLPTIPR